MKYLVSPVPEIRWGTRIF